MDAVPCITEYALLDLSLHSLIVPPLCVIVPGSDASNQRAKLGIIVGVKKLDSWADALKGILLPIYLLKCKNLRLLDSGPANDKLIEEE